jgi:hypothetical protein
LVRNRKLNNVAFSPDGERIASGSEDKTVRLWDVNSGKEIAPFKGHESSVWSVAFSPDGNRIASGSDDKTVRIWRFDLINDYLENGRESPTFRKIYGYSFKLLGYRLDGINLVKNPPPVRAIPLRTVKDPLERFKAPRPLGMDFVDWILANAGDD